MSLHANLSLSRGPAGEWLHGGGVESRTILIVEDSGNTAAVLELALQGIPGAHIRTASSGAEALRVLDGGAPVRVIVTDLNMPLMDGFELIRRVRTGRHGAGIAIVVVSGDEDPEAPGRVAELGADAFFGKPFSPLRVRRKVEQLLDATTS